MFIISARHSMTHQTTIDVLEDEFKMDFNNRSLKTNHTDYVKRVSAEIF